MQARHERILDLLDRFHEAQERGQSISVEQLCADCPELLPDVRRLIGLGHQLSRLAVLEDSAPPARDVETTDEAAPANGQWSTVWPGQGSAAKTTSCPKCARPIDASDANATIYCPGCGTETLPPSTRKQAPQSTDWPGTVSPGATTAPEVTPQTASAHANADAPFGYEILSVLGRGGMGIVYKARQTGLGRVVALKKILAGRADEDAMARFRTEAQAIARLQHPSIVQVFEIGDHDGTPFMALEFCAGGSLDRKLAGKPIDAREAATLVETLGRAMDAAHKANVIHRDLKPANVLLAENGVPKITDFGLARKLDELGQTQAGAVMGSPPYMPPEQATGDTESLGPSVDVYALGATLYECLTGRPPFVGQTVYDTISQVINDEVVPPSRLNPKVPRDLETICLTALHKRPESRYASAAALADDLRRFLENRPILARPAGYVERTVKWARRSPFQAAALGAGVIAVAAALVAMYGLVLAARGEIRHREGELAESQRLDRVRDRATEEYTKEQAAFDRRDWVAVERHASTALKLLEGEPQLAKFSLREPITRLRDRAQGELAGEKEKAEHRGRLALLNKGYSDAIVFTSDMTGADRDDDTEQTLRAIAAGLALFGVGEGTDGPPVIDPRFFSPAETEWIADRCHELLLLEADVLARPRPGEPAEKLHARLRQALARIDRADRVLAKGGPTRAGLKRRERFLTALGEAQAAKAAALAAARTPARLMADHFLEGMDHYRRDEYVDATNSLSIVLRQQPDHYGAEYLLALCRLQQRQFQPGREGLTRCLKMQPTFAWPRLLRGYAAIELGLWNEAREDFDAVLANPPDEVAAYVARVNRGVLGLKRRDWVAAVADLKAAIAMRPGAPAAYVNLALTHRQRAEVSPVQHGLMRMGPMGAFAVLTVDAHQRQARQEAVAVLDEAIEQRPKEARLYHERGRLCLLLDRHEQARDDFTQAVALALTRTSAGTLVDDLIELGQLYYRERRYEEAVRSYETVLALLRNNHSHTGRAAALRLMAKPLLALHRYEKAGKALDEFLETVPVAPDVAPTPEQARTLAEVLKVRGLVYDEQARAFRARGLLHLLKRDQRAALDSYTQGLKLVRDPETLTLRGWTYLTLNAVELALADFEEAERLRPGDGNALLGRANARVRLGQTREALEDVERGVKASPTDARTLYNAARVHAQAVTALRESSRFKDDAEYSEKRATELLGRALERTPAADRATFWKHYVQADKAFDPIRRGSPMTTLAAQFDRPSR